MKVTFVLPDANLGGGTRVVAVYAAQLAARGHDVTVVSTPRRDLTFGRRVKDFVRGRGWQRASKRGPSHIDAVDVRKVYTARRLVTDTDLPDADVVIATWWETAEWVAALSPAKGAKVYLVQGHEVTLTLHKERAAATLRTPMHKIVVSNWLRTIMAQTCGDTAVSDVPNGVDTSVFHAAPRSRQPIPTVGMVYAPSPVKRCVMMLDAIARARTRVPGLRSLIFSASPPHNVRFPDGAQVVVNPPRDQIVRTYASCDAWLFGSEAEGFGLPILEAMACRTPVIATPAGAAPELIQEQGGGVLVPHNDPQAMADAIVRMVGLPDPAWREISDRAIATAQNHTWEHSTEQFEAALRHAIERAHRGEIAGGVRVAVPA